MCGTEADMCDMRWKKINLHVILLCPSNTFYNPILIVSIQTLSYKYLI